MLFCYLTPVFLMGEDFYYLWPAAVPTLYLTGEAFFTGDLEYLAGDLDCRWDFLYMTGDIVISYSVLVSEFSSASSIFCSSKAVVLDIWTGSSLIWAGEHPLLFMEENRLLLLSILLWYGFKPLLLDSGDNGLVSDISLVPLSWSYEFSLL